LSIAKCQTKKTKSIHIKIFLINLINSYINKNSINHSFSSFNNSQNHMSKCKYISNNKCSNGIKLNSKISSNIWTKIHVACWNFMGLDDSKKLEYTSMLIKIQHLYRFSIASRTICNLKIKNAILNCNLLMLNLLAFKVKLIKNL
jgi:hypothetical protein